MKASSKHKDRDIKEWKKKIHSNNKTGKKKLRGGEKENKEGKPKARVKSPIP